VLSAIAILGIAGAALVLLALPAVIAVRLVALPGEWVGAAVTLLGSALLGVKLIAMALGAGGRLLAAIRTARAVATAD
jgi:hypothetical protein